MLANDDAKCTGEGCPLRLNCERFTRQVVGSGFRWWIAPAYSDESKSCVLQVPVVSGLNQLDTEVSHSSVGDGLIPSAGSNAEGVL